MIHRKNRVDRIAPAVRIGSMDYDRMARALRYLEEHRAEQPDLERVARHVDLSPHHFQRLFQEWVGISPKRFLQFLTVEQARASLDGSRSVLDATFDAGLSSPGRLHDLLVSIDAVTPGEYKRQGEGLSIRYGVQPSPFGDCLVAGTGRGVCWLSFHDSSDVEEGLAQLRRTWERATLEPGPAESRDWRDRIFGGRGPLPLLVRGTNFQLKVWEALVRVPAGRLCSYGDLARWVGRPKAARAVGSAVAANPVALLIPCHRVIRSAGTIGDYRWGAPRKRALVAYELAGEVRGID